MSSFPFSSQFRVFLIYSSFALSLTLMLLMLNIITTKEIIEILRINPHGIEAKTITNILIRMQEVTNNIMEIIAKLFSKVLNSFGMADIDLSKIRIKPGTHDIPSIPDTGVGTPSVPDTGVGTPSVPDTGVGTPSAPNTGVGEPLQCENGNCSY